MRKFNEFTRFNKEFSCDIIRYYYKHYLKCYQNYAVTVQAQYHFIIATVCVPQ